MKINFTKKEYRLLIEVLSLGHWMMHAHAIDEQDRYPEHEGLRKKLLSYYKEMGAEDIIEYSQQLDNFYETNSYDEYIHKKFVEPYDDESFWDELIDKLAVRDVIHDIGIEKYQALEGIERIRKVEEAKEFYIQEFQKHGITRIIISDKNIVEN